MSRIEKEVLYSAFLKADMASNPGLSLVRHATDGPDTIQGDGTDETLSGQGGDDFIDGAGGNDDIFGDDGNDTLLGGSGNDYIEDGSGDDSVNGGPGDDYINNIGGSDTFLGGSGNDTLEIDVSQIPDTGLVAEFNLLTNFGGRQNSTVGQDFIDQIENIRFRGDWDVLLVGNGEDNRLTSGAGNDTLIGNGGRDRLYSGNGNDLLDASGGSVESQGVGDLARPGLGNDTIIGHEALFNAGEGIGVIYYDLSGVGGLTFNIGPNGTGTVTSGTPGLVNDTFTFANYFEGSNDGDVFNGSNEDRYEGYAPLGGADTVHGNGGYDQINYQYERTELGDLGSGIVADIQAGTVIDTQGYTDVISGIEEIRGSVLDDFMTAAGSQDDISFRGEDGNDTLIGGRGDDRLQGQNGDDSIFGGAGRDRLFGGDGNDTLNASGGSTESQGFGDDIRPGLGSNTIQGHAGLFTDGDSADLSYGDLSGTGGLTITNGVNGTGTVVSASPGQVNDTFTYIGYFEGSQDNDVYNGADSDFFESFAPLGGADTINGNGGYDQITYKYESSYFDGIGSGIVVSGGTSGTVTDTQGNTDIYTGIEQIRGSERGDTMSAAGTNESIQFRGGGGNDQLTGGAGDDTLRGGDGNDTLTGGFGDDEIVGGDGDDRLGGGDGNDSMNGGDGNDSLAGSDGNDLVNGGDGNDNIGGGTGNDVISGGNGNDTIGAGQGDDTADGGAGHDIVNGGAGDDSLFGSSGNDTMGASLGNDTVLGGDGNDEIGGGAGRDLIEGGSGDDSIGGGEGNDTVNGGLGDNFLAGGGRNDVISGGDGNDTINGGDGDDTMTGGDGADVFVFNFFKDGDEDVITDYEDGADSFLIRIVDTETGEANIDNGGNGLQGYVNAMNITDTVDGAMMTIDGHTILVENVAASDLTLDDFAFL